MSLPFTYLSTFIDFFVVPFITIGFLLGSEVDTRIRRKWRPKSDLGVADAEDRSFGDDGRLSSFGVGQYLARQRIEFQGSFLPIDKLCK